MHCSRRLIVQTLVFCRSYLHRQVSPPRPQVVKGGTTWVRNGRWILPENVRLPRNIQGSFMCRKCTAWDERLYFPSEGRRAEDFFALKNLTASPGFEPANLGTKDQQHATSRPPKPLSSRVVLKCYWMCVCVCKQKRIHKNVMACTASSNTHRSLVLWGKWYNSVKNAMHVTY